MEGAWRVLETHMPSCLKFNDHVSLELWVRFAQWKYMISSEDPWPHYCRALREYPRRLQNPTCEVALGEEVRARLHWSLYGTKCVKIVVVFVVVLGLHRVSAGSIELHRGSTGPHSGSTEVPQGSAGAP